MSLLNQFWQHHRIKLQAPSFRRFVFVFLVMGGLLGWYVWTAKAAVTITVTTTNDVDGTDGFCSLREAIIAANINAPRFECFHDGSPGTDTIAFNITGPGPHTIFPTTTMTNIIAPVILDGATEPDYAGTPVVVLNGSSAGDTDGLIIDLGGTTIRGLAINNFGSTGAGDGIVLLGGSNYVIEENHIGTDAAGTADQGNFSDGIFVSLTVTDVTIRNNVIAGNNQNGIFLNGNLITNVTIQGNYIGTDVTGVAPIANGLDGVQILNGFDNRVGGSSATERNIISGNGRYGVYINGPQATNNRVEGNYIGTDSGGDTAIPNSSGVVIDGGFGNRVGDSSSAVAGGFCDGGCNLISGNTVYGVEIAGIGTNSNIIESNYIGTDASGTAALANMAFGIRITNANNNHLGGTIPEALNLISGNNFGGIQIAGDDADTNFIEGNIIGLDITGANLLGNLQDGVIIDQGDANSVGGNGAGMGNVIAGNGRYGVYVVNDANSNVVSGNLIGSDASGTADLGNGGNGIYIQDGANNLVGGITPVERNLVSGNGGAGVYLTGSSSTTFNNQILGNYIGTTISGTAVLSNTFSGVVIDSGINNLIGGTDPNAGNLISGNGQNGIYIIGATTISNTVQSNKIGTDATGTADLGNSFHGIWVQAPQNTIGTPGHGNLISGNAQDGIYLVTADATINTIQGNKIGTDVNGTAALGNGSHGIEIADAPNNLVGGVTAGTGNLVSGNLGDGVLLYSSGLLNSLQLANPINNRVEGNIIGLDVNGQLAIGNAFAGVAIFNSSFNVVGGTAVGSRNIISGNAGDGIKISSSQSADGNLVQGNYIGTNVDGETAVPNGTNGILIDGAGTQNNTIGGTVLEAANLISGNTLNGIFISNGAFNNFVQGNAIGTNATVTTALGNTGPGITISGGAFNNQIGGVAVNYIAYNNGPGIVVQDVSTTGNAIWGNHIYANGEIGIDLGADGVTFNDNGDGDFGPNQLQNFPVLFSAVPDGSATLIQGRIDGMPKTNYEITFFLSGNCDPAGYGEGESYLGGTTVSSLTDEIVISYTVAANLPYGKYITAVSTDSALNSSEFSRCVTIGRGNTTWPTAYEPAATHAPFATYVITDFIDAPDQSRWYRVPVDPSSNLSISLTDLPANYDLTVYKDISQAFQEEITTTEDLLLLSAEFAPDIFNPDIFNPDIFNPDIFNPDIFNPDIFNPDIFNPDIFSPDIFNPDIFNPDIFNPDAYSPDIFNPDIFNPDIFNPDIFNSGIITAAFSSAQLSSVVAGSGREGLSDEFVAVKTWNNDGYYYVRVRGRNGTYDASAPFTLSITVDSNVCAGVSPDGLPATSLTAVSNDYTTLIIADWDQLALTNDPADITTLQTRLNTLIGRSEVGGVMVDVGQDARVQAARTLVNNNYACPNAQNILADSIKAIIDLYWAANPDLKYLVLVGNDAVIPFYRHPDQGLLAPESNYLVPVYTNTPSYASLALNYLLSQDAYGASRTISQKTSELPIPELAIGRLVEDATDMITLLDAYLSTADGIITPSTALVTGYDFLEDAANAVDSELQAAGLTPQTLISPQSVSPAEGWTADDLRAALLESGRLDLVYLAGHFSAGSTLAADYTTRLLASEVADSAVDMTNSLIFSAGCHSGYNIVTPDGIPGITAEPDWAQTFAQKGATFVGGTGYQYGDSDFLEYGERLYWLFSQQLSIGSGPVSVGQALVEAKREYLVDTGAETDGIYQKQVLIATLFGLPMVRVDMPIQRAPELGGGSIITVTNTYTGTGPGATLGLEYADVSLASDLTLHTMELVNMNNVSETVTVSYLTGGGAAEQVVVKPAEPVLPLESYDVTVDDMVLRGVGFRGGLFTELPGIRPLTGAATFDLTGPRPIFVSDYYYPTQLWDVNYLGAIIRPADGATNLHLTPAQYQSDAPNSPTGILRQYDQMAFRLFYSNNLTNYSGNVPALSNPPAISKVWSQDDGKGSVSFQIQVVGDPSAGVQEVWITWYDAANPGLWQSFDLAQNLFDSTLWEGTLDPGGNLADMRFMAQAASGVGLVTMATNLGQMYQVGIDPGAPSSNTALTTTLTLDAPPTSGTYGSEAVFTATLTSLGNPLANQLVTFNLGAQRSAVTNSNGQVSVILPLSLRPGDYNLQASFAGTADYYPVTTSSLFTITKQNTVLTITPTLTIIVPGTDSGIVFTLQDANGNTIIQKPVLVVVEGANGWTAVSGITNYLGQFSLGVVELPPGSYQVTAYFGTALTLPDATELDLTDDNYEGGTAVSTLILSETGMIHVYLPVIIRP